MDEQVQMLGNMSLKFDGKDSIDLDTLMSSLSGAAKAYKATLSATYVDQGVEIGLNVKAFAPGSVEVLLESVVSAAPVIAPMLPNVISSTKTFLEIVKLKKELKGKTPRSVELEGQTTKITNHDGEIHYHDSTVFNVYLNNPQIDAGLTSMFTALKGSDRPAVSFGTAQERVQIDESDYEAMNTAVVDELAEAEYQKIESIVEEQLLLKSPDFIGDAKWDFYFDKKVIHATIDDNTFMDSVRKGEIKLFAGVKIPVRMKIEVFLNEKLETVKKKYTILEVTGGLIDSSDDSTQLVLEAFNEGKNDVADE